jgi:hypothetical protein
MFFKCFEYLLRGVNCRCRVQLSGWMSRGADLKLLTFFGSSSSNSSNSNNSRNNDSERNFDDLDNKSADLRSFLCILRLICCIS